MGGNESIALNDPDIVAEIVRNLPVKEFGKHLKINRLWYNYCKAELWKRHKEAEEAYDKVANICKKAERAYWQNCADGGINLDKLTDEIEKVIREKYTRFGEMDRDTPDDSDDESDDSDDEK
ncbi:hypothetical protein RhiirA4_472089 [Rhizophagus irregularis]|uniref:F-box domain-containing protein n=1 Tax=Rhizophagus irregularis TaxID=588596 RepID=A0A2I1H4F4_9GLOM|nr:hypothetical protein RhiirA4_472089 [Rhizophagus irregularis]